LSADPDRLLIGDDEHVWSDDGVSNFEDGCYAKLINLDKEQEPVIAAALSMPGTYIENVPALPGKPLSQTHPQELDLFDGSRTENTRFAYPLLCNPSVAEGAAGPHPETIVLLTADAFGVLPPVSILSPEEVMYHFVMGFTSKLAGTEVGVTEPQATFSSCFGAPFMSQKPLVYAELLAKRMADNNARCVLLNTGWTGGAYGRPQCPALIRQSWIHGTRGRTRTPTTTQPASCVICSGRTTKPRATKASAFRTLCSSQSDRWHRYGSLRAVPAKLVAGLSGSI